MNALTGGYAPAAMVWAPVDVFRVPPSRTYMYLEVEWTWQMLVSAEVEHDRRHGQKCASHIFASQRFPACVCSEVSSEIKQALEYECRSHRMIMPPVIQGSLQAVRSSANRILSEVFASARC
jgi:hypothetical protein